MHEQLCQCITAHKESKAPETLTLTQEDMEEILESSGAEDAQVEAFRESCRRDFGEDTPLNPANIINSRRVEIITPEFKISTEPQYSHLVQIKTLDGRKYIMLPADSGVELNGINLVIE